ncbi:MAG TPA: hypothetical protein VKM35_10435 [Arenimonas sp.]|uniref:hypothetical protein n=1 Tax=Arenimonas sp. TaxID=1872635 RepID=UPI002C2D7092|nr:hypothetical protein [Arenimonas sp.]HMB57614.1 hypothetical protein [Arenimonas sp.]
MPYLAPSSIGPTLLRGKSLEQFLGHVSALGNTGIRWLELRPKFNGFEIWAFDVEDVGTTSHVDIYSFPMVRGEPPSFPVALFTTSLEAVNYADKHYGATAKRWLEAGTMKDEYSIFVHEGRPDVWDPPIE